MEEIYYDLANYCRNCDRWRADNVLLCVEMCKERYTISSRIS